MDRRLAELETEARHASEPYRLYRAKVYGPRLTGFGRLRELERESELAERGNKGPTATNVQAH
jgi:hypothetical protein